MSEETALYGSGVVTVTEEELSDIQHGLDVGFGCVDPQCKCSVAHAHRLVRDLFRRMSETLPTAALVPPGDIIREVMWARRWSIERLIHEWPVRLDIAQGVLNGQEKITQCMAYQLAQVFDTSPDLWLNLERAYRESLRNAPHTASQPADGPTNPEETLP